jgi:hypothetical protein
VQLGEETSPASPPRTTNTAAPPLTITTLPASSTSAKIKYSVGQDQTTGSAEISTADLDVPDCR